MILVGHSWWIGLGRCVSRLVGPSRSVGRLGHSGQSFSQSCQLVGRSLNQSFGLTVFSVGWSGSISHRCGQSRLVGLCWSVLVDLFWEVCRQLVCLGWSQSCAISTFWSVVFICRSATQPIGLSICQSVGLSVLSLGLFVSPVSRSVSWLGSAGLRGLVSYSRSQSDSLGLSVLVRHSWSVTLGQSISIGNSVSIDLFLSQVLLIIHVNELRRPVDE